MLLRGTFYHLDALRFRLKIRYVAREDDTYLDEHSQTSTLPDAEPIAIIKILGYFVLDRSLQQFPGSFGRQLFQIAFGFDFCSLLDANQAPSSSLGIHPGIPAGI